MPAIQQLVKSAHLQVEDSHRHFNIKPVLTHGDFWFKNILFKKDERGRASNKVHSVLDWQNCHLGGLSHVYLINYGCSRNWSCGYSEVHTELNKRSGSTNVHGPSSKTLFRNVSTRAQETWTSIGILFGEAPRHLLVKGFLSIQSANFRFHYDFELIFALSQMANEAIKTKDMYHREKTIQKMIAAFEPVRLGL